MPSTPRTAASCGQRVASRPAILLDPSGCPLVWWNSAGSGAFLAIASDPAGDIYLAGFTQRSDSSPALLKKLTASGRILWSAEHGLLEGPDVPGGLCPDGSAVLSDAIFHLRHAFLGGPEPPPPGCAG